MKAAHTPVMLEACLEGLAIKPGRWYIDATFGAGGHSRAMLAAGAKVFAIDQDPLAKTFASTLPDNLQGEGISHFCFKQGNFRQLDTYVKEAELEDIAGVLFDLGLSSMQIDQAERGFAFRQPGPLDMRMAAEGQTAADLVNTLPQEELAAIIYKYGEERHSRRIARAIVEARQQKRFATTDELVTVIQQAYPKGERRDHPARRTFQALRIYLNDELAALEDALAAALRVLAPLGRLVVLSYHSLEDRIVKQFMRSHHNLSILNKKPLTASDSECAKNPRARSAKLRIAEKQVMA